MKDLAIQLALQTSNCFLGVGGPNQIAILQNGRVVSVEQGTYPPQRKLSLPNLIVMNAGLYEGDRIGYFDGSTELAGGRLFTNGQFLGSTVGLDNNYFSGDVFVGSGLIYDGAEAFYFGKSNTVMQCVLQIGPHAKYGDKNVQHLLDDYSWLRIEDKRPKTEPAK
jgi:hypothetical protein